MLLLLLLTSVRQAQELGRCDQVGSERVGFSQQVDRWLGIGRSLGTLLSIWIIQGKVLVGSCTLIVVGPMSLCRVLGGHEIIS